MPHTHKVPYFLNIQAEELAKLKPEQLQEACASYGIKPFAELDEHEVSEFKGRYKKLDETKHKLADLYQAELPSRLAYAIYKKEAEEVLNFHAMNGNKNSFEQLTKVIAAGVALGGLATLAAIFIPSVAAMPLAFKIANTVMFSLPAVFGLASMAGAWNHNRQAKAVKSHLHDVEHIIAVQPYPNANGNDYNFRIADTREDKVKRQNTPVRTLDQAARNTRIKIATLTAA
jgi:hypothetical protein